MIENKDQVAQDSLSRPHNIEIIDLLANTIVPQLYQNANSRPLITDGLIELCRLLDAEVLTVRDHALGRLRGIASLFSDELHEVRLTIQEHIRGIDLMNLGVQALHDEGNSEKKQLREQLFPHTYTFDNGRIRIRAAFGKDEALRLYHAAQEVRTQFFRVIGETTPARNDVLGNETLNILIFPSGASFVEYNRFLHGFPGNGLSGAFLEEDPNHHGRAAFYSFQRTALESAFSLETVFRHEYTHYLQGRHQEQGGDEHSTSRIVGGFWYSEGTAEFFAASTRQDIEPRNDIYANLNRNNHSFRTLFSGAVLELGRYAYNYGAALTNFLYHHRPDTLYRMHRYIRSNEYSRYHELLGQLENDAQLNTEYDTYLDNLINAARGNVREVKAVWIPEDRLGDYSPEEEIQSTLEEASIAISSTAVISSGAPHLNSRRLYSTPMRAEPISSGKVSAGLRALSTVLNEKLDELITNNPDILNYTVATAYCDDVVMNQNSSGSYTPLGNCHFEVPVLDTSQPALTDFSIQVSSDRPEQITITWEDYPDEAYTLYALQRSTDEAGSNPEDVAQGTANTYTDTDLEQYKYYYRLQFCKADQSECTPYTQWTAGRAVLPVSNLRVTYADPTRTVLAWSPLAAASSYGVWFYVNTQLADGEKPALVAPLIVATTYTHTYRTPGQKTYFITAYYDAEELGVSEYVTPTSGEIQLSIERGDEGVLLTWKKPFKYNITYVIERSYEAEGNELMEVFTTNDVGEQSSYTVSTALPAGMYYYRVRLRSADGAEHSYTTAWQSVEQSVKMYAPVQGFRVAFAAPTQTVLTWAPHPEASSYTIGLQLADGEAPVVLGSTAATTYTHIYATHGQKVYSITAYQDAKKIADIPTIELFTEDIALGITKKEQVLTINWSQPYKYGATYILERSYGGEGEALTQVSTNSAKDEQGSYTENTTALPEGNYYYRIKLNSADEKYSYTSDWQAIQIEREMVILHVHKQKAERLYPNPVTGVLKLRGAPATLRVYNLTGKLLRTHTYVQQIHLGDMPTGLYIIEVVRPGSYTRRYRIHKR